MSGVITTLSDLYIDTDIEVFPFSFLSFVSYKYFEDVYRVGAFFLESLACFGLSVSTKTSHLQRARCQPLFVWWF